MLQKNWPADKVERWPIDRLVPYARNARTHTDEQIAQIAASIQEWGWTNPVLVGEDGRIIAGHARVLAGRKLGLAQVPVMLATGWSEAQRRAYVLADNQLALNASWDPELLRLELGELQELNFDLNLIGFDEAQLAALTANPGLTDPDEVPEPPAVPVAQRGEVWALGRHRLVCGDATAADDVARALAGVAPHLMVTDPPYGVMLDPSWRDRAGINSMGKAGKGGDAYMESGKADTEARWDGVWALFPGDVFYVWCAGFRLVEVYTALMDQGLETRQQLIWEKSVLTRTRTHYWWSHEHCLYGVRKGKTAHWIGAPGQSTVWKIASPKHIMGGSEEENLPHPAQKPVECMKRPIENNSSPGQAVYDPFVGSGTTIIAAEMTGRACHAIEINPTYIDVTIERWQNFTGEKAKRVEVV
jgi:DNA modification methylase